MTAPLLSFHARGSNRAPYSPPVSDHAVGRYRLRVGGSATKLDIWTWLRLNGALVESPLAHRYTDSSRRDRGCRYVFAGGFLALLGGPNGVVVTLLRVGRVEDLWADLLLRCLGFPLEWIPSTDTGAATGGGVYFYQAGRQSKRSGRRRL